MTMTTIVEYLTDDGPRQMDGGSVPKYFVMRREPNGDFYVGLRAINERTSTTMRFRMGNGGASEHPRLTAALCELYNALREVE